MSARVVVALALATCGCQAVPDVVYDAGTIPEGGNTCLDNVVPSYASVCCGPIACSGANCIAACNDCQSQCKLTDLCCPNAQSHAVCHSNATACP